MDKELANNQINNNQIKKIKIITLNICGNSKDYNSLQYATPFRGR